MQQAHAHTHICQSHSNAKETLRNQLMQQQNPYEQGFLCKSYCKQCYVAACEANICPGPHACHVTNQSHQIHLTTVGT